MKIVMDAMVLIHLAKLTLLESVCEMFENVIIPELVYEETVGKGVMKGYSDAVLIQETVEKGLVGVEKVGDKELTHRAHRFNVQAGEAEAVALYWQENASFLASDDDNLRSKRVVLDLDMRGNPVIILKLWKQNMIKEEKFKASLEQLREIGWFSNAVIDKVLQKGRKNMSKSVGIRMDEELLKKLEELSKEEGVDRSTLVRRLLRKGIKLHRKETAAQKYRKGKITISQAAQEAGTTIWEMEKFLVESGYTSQYSIKDLQREAKI